MYLQVILLAVVATLSSGWIWHPVTWPMIYPLVSGFFVGLILEDPYAGMAAGAYINLLFLGWITAGGAMPGNVMFAGVFGTALVVVAGIDPLLAPVLAIPLSLAGLLLWRLQMTVNTVWVRRADRHAGRGQIRAVELSAYLYPQLTVLAIHLLPAFLVLYFGSSLKVLNQGVPESLISSLAAAGGMLPALGIAMLLQYLGKTKVIPLFFIGYLAAAYLDLGLIVIAVFSGLFAVYSYLNKPGTNLLAGAGVQGGREDLPRKLRRSDLLCHWLRCYSQEAGYNYERLQAGGACAAAAPIIRRLYHNKEDISAALKRYLVFFNTEPAFIGPCIAGLAASMEEQRAGGADISDVGITSIRTGLMGPLAGIGDSVAHGIIYPTLISVAVTLAVAGNMVGPVLFMVLFGGAMLYIGYSTYMLGYIHGKTAITALLKSDLLRRVTEAAAIAGLPVLGALGAEKITINFDATFAGMDSLLPNLAPLAIILTVWLAVRKKVSPVVIMVALVTIAVVGTYLGLFASRW